MGQHTYHFSIRVINHLSIVRIWVRWLPFFRFLVFIIASKRLERNLQTIAKNNHLYLDYCSLKCQTEGYTIRRHTACTCQSQACTYHSSSSNTERCQGLGVLIQRVVSNLLRHKGNLEPGSTLKPSVAFSNTRHNAIPLPVKIFQEFYS